MPGPEHRVRKEGSNESFGGAGCEAGALKRGTGMQVFEGIFPIGIVTGIEWIGEMEDAVYWIAVCMVSY